MHMRMDARGTGPPARQQPGEGIWSACDMHMRMDARGTGPPARQQLGEGIWSACDMRMRMDARGTCTPAGQQPGEGIWSAFAMHMRMDARGAGATTCMYAAEEGIWSACDMHMRMDARGTGPSAGQQPGEGIWSAFAMHATTDARVPRAVDTCESSNLRSHSRSTTSVATKIDLASRVPRASCPTLEESRRRRTAPALSAISSPHASLMATTPMSANTPPRAVSTDTTLISLHPRARGDGAAAPCERAFVPPPLPW